MYKDNLLNRIIIKDYRGHRREMLALIVCESVLLALIYTCAAGYQKFTKAYSSDLFIFMQEGDIGTMFISAGMILLLGGLVITMTVLISYLRKRIPDYMLLKRMGITGRDTSRMILSEFAIAYGASVLAGFILGIALSSGLEAALKKTLHESSGLGQVAWFTYPAISAVILLLFLVGFVLVKEMEGDFRLLSGSGDEGVREKLAGRLAVPMMVIGVLLIAVSAASYRKLYNHESILYIAAFLLGTYLFGRNLAGLILRREKAGDPDRYYSRLLINNRFYCRLGTVSRYALIYSVLSVMLCFYFPMQIITILHAEPVADLFPYDFVCIADDNDEDLIRELKDRYGAEITEYPIVRISTADKTEHVEAVFERHIQGQQIGISESTYHSLKKAVDADYVIRDLGLDDNGDNVYVVHQQDKSVKAQPLDWYYTKSKPDLHIGVPCASADYYNRHVTYGEKNIAGEEIGSLIGCLSTDKNENIVVLSDRYFASAQDEWKTVDVGTGMHDEDAAAYFDSMDPGYVYEPVHIQGPTRLVLINADPEYVESIDTVLQSREENHNYIGSYDSTVRFHYPAKTASRDIETSRATRLMLSVCMMIAFLLMKALILHAMCQMEREERRRRDEFLSKIGAPAGLRKRIVRRELLVYFVIPVAVMCIAAVLFSSGVYSARMYSPELIRACAKYHAAACAVIAAVEFIYICILCKIEERGIGISNE